AAHRGPARRPAATRRRLPPVPQRIVGADDEELETTVGVARDDRRGDPVAAERLPAGRPAAVRDHLPAMVEPAVRTDGEDLQPAVGVARDGGAVGQGGAAASVRDPVTADRVIRAAVAVEPEVVAAAREPLDLLVRDL